MLVDVNAHQELMTIMSKLRRFAFIRQQVRLIGEEEILYNAGSCQLSFYVIRDRTPYSFEKAKKASERFTSSFLLAWFFTR